MQGKLLEESADKLNSLNLLKHMTPIAAAALLLLVMLIEPDVRDAIPARESPDFVPFCVLLLLNGLLSFAVNLSNFLVTQYTSPLTLQVRVLHRCTGPLLADVKRWSVCSCLWQPSPGDGFSSSQRLPNFGCAMH